MLCVLDHTHGDTRLWCLPSPRIVLQERMSTDSTDRDPPRRHLDKQEAIRHLVHGAIRLVMAKEDPFVIQLVVHSADKLLIDVAKKMGTYLELDWELYIKDTPRVAPLPE